MAIISPVSDLRNYNTVLEQVCAIRRLEVVKREFIQERKKMQSESHERQDDGSNTFYL